MRILWADDQPDVVKTLLPLLAPLKAKVEQAHDGDEALRLAASSNFDIILLDLQMPPEQWGGLWFLEQRLEAGIATPVLVLSGEGQQRETIEAMRLGIEDYIRKEDVERELVARVREVLARADKQLEPELLQSAPALIAVPFKRYIAATEPTIKLHRLLELYEGILRMSAFVALAEHRGEVEARSLGTADGLSIGALAAPAMGSWNRVRTSLSKALPEEALSRRLDLVFVPQLTERFIKVRNDVSHGGEPSSLVAQELLDELEPPMRGVLTRLRRARLAMVIPESMQFDLGRFTMDGVAARGDSLAFPAVQIASDAPLTTHRVYASAGAAGFVDLHPLVLAHPSREPGAWRVCVFDGIRGVRPNDASLKGTERLRYTNLWTGERDVDPEAELTSSDLRGLMPGW
jgi:DNA-binding response OmpR family regulator